MVHRNGPIVSSLQQSPEIYSALWLQISPFRSQNIIETFCSHQNDFSDRKMKKPLFLNYIPDLERVAIGHISYNYKHTPNIGGPEESTVYLIISFYLLIIGYQKLVSHRHQCIYLGVHGGSDLRTKFIKFINIYFDCDNA